MANACVIYAGQVLDCNGFNETDNSNAAQLVYKNISYSGWEEIFLDDTQTDGLRQNAKNPTDADAYVYDKNGNLVIFESPCPKKLICTYESMTDKLLGNTEGIWSMELDCRNENNQPSSASSATAMVTVLSDIGNGYKAGDTAETTYVSASCICKYDFSGETLPSETGYDRFKGCTALTRCDLLCSMSEISQATFSGCTNLSSYTNTNFVSKIGVSAFTNCTKLENIVIGPHVRFIENSAFANCTNAKNLIFKYGTISKTNCDINYDRVKEGLSGDSFADYTFANCTSLSGTSFPGSGGATPINGIVIPDNFLRLALGCFSGCTAIRHFSGNSLVNIGSSAFKGCTNLQTVYLPNAETFIGSSFSDCTSLQTVDFPKATLIGGGCFKNCSSLTSVTLSNCTDVGGYAFSGCNSLREIYLGNGQFEASLLTNRFVIWSFFNLPPNVVVTLNYSVNNGIFDGLRNVFEDNTPTTFKVSGSDAWSNYYRGTLGVTAWTFEEI